MINTACLAQDSSDDILTLDTVVVEGIANKTALGDTPVTTSSITSETISQRQIRNIKDLIRYEPGITVGNDPQRFGATGFNIRGLGGNRVLMQIDGVRLPDAFSIGSFASSTRNMVDLDALKAVDFTRGSGSANYGGDALAGTVNYVTKDPRDYLDVFGHNYYADLKLAYNSTDDSFLQTSTFAGALGGLESMLLVTHSDSSETDNKGDNTSQNPTRTAPSPQDNKAYNVLGKILYHFNSDNILRLTGEATHSTSDIDALYTRGKDFSFRTVNSQITNDRQNRWRLSLDQEIKNLGLILSDNFSWRVHAQHSSTYQATYQDRTSNAEGQALTKRLFNYDNDNFGAALQFDKTVATGFSNHQFQYGAQVNVDEITQQRDGTVTYAKTGLVSSYVLPDDFPVRDFPVSTVTKAGFFIQDNITFREKRIEVLPGLRLEHYHLQPSPDALFTKGAGNLMSAEIDVYKFLPKIGLLYHLNDLLTLHGQYAEGFRGPNFADANVGFTNQSAGYMSIPNLDLKPETSVGGEIGLRAKGSAGNFDLTFYRNEYQNFIYNSTICDPSTGAACPPYGFLTYQTINSPDKLRIQGIEFKSELFLDWLIPSLQSTSLILSGAYAEGENLVSGETNSLALRTVAPLKGVIGLRYEQPAGKWGSELLFTMVAAKPNSTTPKNTAFIPQGYGVVDLNGFYRFGEHVSLNLGLYNLFDKKYIDWEDVNTRTSDPHAGLGPYANANANIWDRYSRPGRNVGVSLKIAF
ncbi:MAG: TonB-dependent hemoglobin/transferrin/lactoferrin family receptor [Methylococcales bacterium]